MFILRNVLFYIWQTYSNGIPKIKLTNVEIQEQTASLKFIFKLKGKFAAYMKQALSKEE